MKSNLIIKLGLILLFFSCNTKLIIEHEAYKEEKNEPNRLENDQSESSLRPDTLSHKNHHVKAIKIRRADKECYIKIKSYTKYLDHLLPIIITVKLPSGEKIKYRSIVEPVSKILSTIPRFLKNQIKTRITRDSNGLESDSHSTFRLHSLESDKLKKSNILSKKKNKYYWTSLTIDKVAGGKIEIEPESGFITKFKLDDDFKNENFFFNRNSTCLKNYLIENQIIPKQNLAHSLIKRGDKDNDKYEDTQNFTIYSGKSSGHSFHGIISSSPTQLQIIEELFSFYFLKNHDNEHPLFSIIQCISSQPFYENFELKSVNALTLEKQFISIKVTETIISKKGETLAKNIQVNQKNEQGESLDQYILSLDY